MEQVIAQSAGIQYQAFYLAERRVVVVLR